MDNKALAVQDIYRLFKLYDPPQRIKTASADALATPPAGSAPNLFADPVDKQYPVHTAAATWLSAARFFEKKAEHSPRDAEAIQERLQRSANYFLLEGEFKQLQQKVAAAVATDVSLLPDEDFAFVWRNGDDAERRLPLRNSGEVKAAADYITEHRQSFRLADRRTMAENVLRKAAAYGTDLGTERTEAMRKAAGLGSCTTAMAIEALQTRAMLLRDRNEMMAQTFAKLAGALAKDASAIHSPGRLHKLAEILDNSDRITGLYRKYDGKPLSAPEDTLFALDPIKTAKDVLSTTVPLSTGALFEKQACALVPVHDWREMFGDEMANDISFGGFVDAEKLADSLQKLGMAEAKIAERVLADNGVYPVHRQKVSYPFAAEEILAVANQVAAT